MNTEEQEKLIRDLSAQINMMQAKLAHDIATNRKAQQMCPSMNTGQSRGQIQAPPSLGEWVGNVKAEVDELESEITKLYEQLEPCVRPLPPQVAPESDNKISSPLESTAVIRVREIRNALNYQVERIRTLRNYLQV